MLNCLTCKNILLDKEQGDYICQIRKDKIYILLESDECKFYDEKESKQNGMSGLQR